MLSSLRTRRCAVVFGVAGGLALLHTRAATACSPICDPTVRPASLLADVPTDLGAHLVQAGVSCGDPAKHRIDAVRVTDATGAVVPGSFSGSDWKPTTPLVPLAPYVMTEIDPPLGQEARVLPFVANAGPAPDPKAVVLTLEASADRLLVDGTVCCVSGGYGQGSCGGSSVCATSAQHTEHQVALRADGGDVRWFQSFENPDKNAPIPEEGEVCRRYRVLQPNGNGAEQRVCLTLPALPKAPDTCPAVRGVYEGCDDPNGALTAAAKACGADDKGCSIGRGPGAIRSGAILGASAALVACALLARRRRSPTPTR